jgi:hypothetical protein
MPHNPKLNGSGCKDLTAYEAIKNTDKMPELVTQLVKVIKQLADISGFEIIGRIGLRNKTTGKEYK